MKMYPGRANLRALALLLPGFRVKGFRVRILAQVLFTGAKH